MINRYYVVDDFYSNPDEVVRAALASIESGPSQGNFAGAMTSIPFLAEECRELFRKLLLEPSIDSSTSLNGRLRFTRRFDTFRQHIHFDGGVRTKWAGVVYLSRRHPPVEGTSFWRHKRTGLEQMPRTVEEMRSHGWHSNEDIRHFLEIEGIDETLWDKTLTIPYKYNRLVMFRPWVFHSPGPAFGDSYDDSRIIQTLFLGNKEASSVR